MTQKNLMAIFLFTISAMLGCNGGQEARWQSERDSMMLANHEQKQVLDGMSQTLTEVSACLDSIAEGENMLRKMGEGPTVNKKELLERLVAFKQLLAQNKERMAQLEAELSGQDQKLEKLGRLVKHLNAELAAKEQRIAELEQMLNSANADNVALREQLNSTMSAMGELQAENEQQRSTIQANEAAHYTAYYCAGTARELKEAGITSGGFLKKKKINYDTLDRSLFEKIDIRTTTQLTIQTRSIKVLSGAPADSYTITRNGDNCLLTIEDIDRFWSASRYLVLQIN